MTCHGINLKTKKILRQCLWIRPRIPELPCQLWCWNQDRISSLKDDMQRFFTKLMQKSFLAAYCNINPSV